MRRCWIGHERRLEQASQASKHMDLGRGAGSHEREERISPREGELIKYRDMRTPLVFHMLTGETIEGAIRWYDNISVRVVKPDRTEVTLFFHALSHYNSKDPAS